MTEAERKRNGSKTEANMNRGLGSAETRTGVHGLGSTDWGLRMSPGGGGLLEASGGAGKIPKRPGAKNSGRTEAERKQTVAETAEVGREAFWGVGEGAPGSIRRWRRF